eukprot:scaffold266612_cov285-Cyclotella_meneghiniana.AAC.2
MESIEKEFQLERSKRLQSEQELQNLRASLDLKEDVPSSDSGTETIDSDRSKSHSPQQKVKFHSLPPSKRKSHTPSKKKKHHPHLREPGQNIHKRAAKKRRRQQDGAIDAEQDSLTVSETSSLRQPLNSSKPKKKSRNKAWKRQNDTRKH